MHDSGRLLVAVIVVTFLPSPASSVFAQRAGDGGDASPELNNAIRLRIGAGRNVLSALPTMRKDKTQLLQIKAVQEELKLEGDVLEKVKLALKGHSGKRRQLYTETVKAVKTAADGNEREQLSEELASKLRAEVVEKATKLRTRTDKILAALLTRKQWERLGQLHLQRKLSDGVHAVLLEKNNAKKLAITREQTTKLQALKQEAEKNREQERTERLDMMKGALQAEGDRDANRSQLRELLKDLQATQAKRRKQYDEKAIASLSDEQRKTFNAMKGRKFTFPKSARSVSSGGGGGGFRISP